MKLSSTTEMIRVILHHFHHDFNVGNMDSSQTDHLDIYCIGNGEVYKKNNKMSYGGNISSTYDDVFKRQGAEYLPKFNSNEYPTKHVVSHFKKCVFFYFILIIALVAGVVLFVISYILDGDRGISSTNKYPLLNPDRCDPVNPYYSRSWFTPFPTHNFICDAPIPVSEIYVESINIYTANHPIDCVTTLDCMYLIGLHYLAASDKSEYIFFIDNSSNVYGGRGWMCPYVSGQLWVGILVDSYRHDGEPEEIKRINNEIMSYGRECGFHIISSSLNSNNINIT